MIYGGFYSGDIGFCLGLPSSGRPRPRPSTPARPADPANFGIAPGLRATKAKRAKRSLERGQRVIDAWKRFGADQHPCWLNACHEAGHAVAALVCGMKLQGTCRFGLSYGPNVLGFCHADSRAVAPRMTGIVAYAGAMAESQATGKTSIPLTADDSRIVDRAIARHLRGRVTMAGDYACRVAWKEGAKILVSRSWPAIKAVATELRMRGYLNGDAVRAIVAQHIDLD